MTDGVVIKVTIQDHDLVYTNHHWLTLEPEANAYDEVHEYIYQIYSDVPAECITRISWENPK